MAWPVTFPLVTPWWLSPWLRNEEAPLKSTTAQEWFQGLNGPKGPSVS